MKYNMEWNIHKKLRWKSNVYVRKCYNVKLYFILLLIHKTRREKKIILWRGFFFSLILFWILEGIFLSLLFYSVVVAILCGTEKGGKLNFLLIERKMYIVVPEWVKIVINDIWKSSNNTIFVIIRNTRIWYMLVRNDNYFFFIDTLTYDQIFSQQTAEKKIFSWRK